MKVIEKREWALKIDCDSCKSTLELECDDVTVTVYEDDPNAFWFVCVCCGATVNIPMKSIPKHVQSAAYKKRGR